MCKGFHINNIIVVFIHRIQDKGSVLHFKVYFGEYELEESSNIKVGDIIS